MPTFIDESGDPGVVQGSSRFFRLAAVWFEHEISINQYLEAVENLRSHVLRLPATFEFHFARNNNRQKAAFFNRISQLDFNFALCSFDKAGFETERLTTHFIKKTTVDGLIGQLREWYPFAEGCKAGNAGLNERIVFDQSDDADYVAILKAGFRSLPSGRGPLKKLIRSIKPGKSRVDPRLQLVDMVCGAVGSYLDGDDTFYKLFSAKKIGIELLSGK